MTLDETGRNIFNKLRAKAKRELNTKRVIAGKILKKCRGRPGYFGLGDTLDLSINCPKN